PLARGSRRHQGTRSGCVAPPSAPDLSGRRRGGWSRCPVAADLRARTCAMSPDEVMREVRRLEITTRHLVRDIVAGEYSSALRGRGVEFSEVREYQPGDDIRTIDWNVTARLGSAYVKRYLEERELTVLFVVDASASEQ